MKSFLLCGHSNFQVTGPYENIEEVNLVKLVMSKIVYISIIVLGEWLFLITSKIDLYMMYILYMFSIK